VRTESPTVDALAPVEAWFAARRWTPFEFQRRAWGSYLEGRSGLVHAPTGLGKSLSVWMGPVAEGLARGEVKTDGCRVLWLTPMRALASDTVRALEAPLADLGLKWTVEKRTGDTAASVKARQRTRLPSALVTTPESLSLLLSYPDARERLRGLRAVVVDEWHELLSSKRGSQTELCLARLRAWNPGLRTWGLSATLGNLDEAMRTLLGFDQAGELVCGDLRKETRVETLMPREVERFPWSGHLGLNLLPEVLEFLDGASGTTLLFTNTRSQTELWFRALSEARPQWLGQLAVHHGSLDSGVRKDVEALLATGGLRCVCCTSSLDLGVDFSPVDQVIQVGSPKGVARLLQRAGRSGHRPGAVSAVHCVATQALELVEFAAAREAAAARRIEAREPIDRPLDVLVQHLVTCALGGGFSEEEMLREVRTARSYRGLGDAEWRWCLDFVERGGSSLAAYPQYARVRPVNGRYEVASAQVARLHRLSIGTISSDTALKLRYVSGASIGTIEESFIGRLKPGDRFFFAGKRLEFVRVKEMTAYVRPSSRPTSNVPKWAGGRSPLSSELAYAVREKLDGARRGVYDDAEVALVRPLLELQGDWSRLPAPDELLMERVTTRDGHHVFLFPIEGRLVHEGLGALLAHRLTSREARTVSVTVNDYGIELLSDEPLPEGEDSWRRALSRDGLLDDLMSCLNSTELTRRQFRDIARVAGLVFPGYPGGGQGMRKTSRQLQASSDLFFDVFAEFDPGNRLLEQARREVLQQQLEAGRLAATLEAIEGRVLVVTRPAQLTPFGFPLWAERLRTQHVTSERWADRVKKMAVRLEKAADVQMAKRQRTKSKTKSAARGVSVGGTDHAG